MAKKNNEVVPAYDARDRNENVEGYQEGGGTQEPKEYFLGGLIGLGTALAGLSKTNPKAFKRPSQWRSWKPGRQRGLGLGKLVMGGMQALSPRINKLYEDWQGQSFGDITDASYMPSDDLGSDVDSIGSEPQPLGDDNTWQQNTGVGSSYQEGGKTAGEAAGEFVKGREWKSHSEEMKIFLQNATLKQVTNYVKFNGPGTEFGPMTDKAAKLHAKKLLRFNTRGSARETERKVQKSHGGKMKGPSHENGGIDINVEGEEIVINKTKNNAAGIHEKDLLALNNNPNDYTIVNKNEDIWPSLDARKRGE